MKRWTCAGDFNDRMLKEFMKFYNECENEGVLEAAIYIDSYGGEVHTADSIISIMENSTIKFHTCVIGRAYSAGLLLAAAGQKRWATNRAEFMFHDISSEVEGKAREMREYVELTEKESKRVLGFFAKKTKKVLNWWISQTKKKESKDFYFNDKQALRYGVIDKIGIPEKKKKKEKKHK